MRFIFYYPTFSQILDYMISLLNVNPNVNFQIYLYDFLPIVQISLIKNFNYHLIPRFPLKNKFNKHKNTETSIPY